MRYNASLGVATLALFVLPASGALVEVVDKPDASLTNAFYAGNRSPLLPSPLITLPFGSIKPQGWLRKQLELEADGFTGHLAEISSFCKKEGNAWLNPKGEGNGSWEEVPYWFRGYAALGYVLDDAKLIKEAQPWIEAAIASQTDDGYFGPRANLGGPVYDARKMPDLMPNMNMLFALRAYYDYTGDKRVLELMKRYFEWELKIPTTNSSPAAGRSRATATTCPASIGFTTAPASRACWIWRRNCSVAARPGCKP